LLVVTAVNSQTLEFRDDLGHKIRLNSCPQRIVSLAPNLTEILFASGSSKKSPVLPGIAITLKRPEAGK